MKELLSLIIQNIVSFEKSLQFRKGQRPFYDAIIDGLKKGWTTMYIEGPTGMGKTFIEAVLAAAVIGNSDIKVLLLTSKITLLQQIQREFKKFVEFLKTGLFGGGFKNYSEQVTIMTYASFVNLDEDIAQQYSVVLLDEGHKGLGEKTKAKLERQKDFSILIGFTASAEYSEEKSLESFLNNLAYKLSIEEAVELGMLSNIKVMIASVDIEISSQEKGESKGDYEERISAEIIREGGNIACARLYKRVFARRNLRGIALVLTKNQGKDLVEQCALEGVKAELIHSGMKRAEREDMFTRFKNHEFSVLVGMGIIKEGFDDSGVSVAMTTYPVGSRVDMTQFPGRAERIDEDNPNKVAYIVNFAFKAKKQLFYTDILDGKSEVLQKKKRIKKLDIISSSEMQSAIATKPNSFITSVSVTENEVKEVMRNMRGLEAYSEDEIIKLAKAELAKHSITSRVSLLNTKSYEFSKLNFGVFGSGHSFSKFLLTNEKFEHVCIIHLEQIAELFGWDDKIKTIKNAKVELAKHGITSRVSLLNSRTYKFAKLNFGVFKKGRTFVSFILPHVASDQPITVENFEEIAEVLGWDDKLTIQDAKAELAKHGITSRVTLLNFGSYKFAKLNLGAFGKSRLFVKFILMKCPVVISMETLEQIADVFEWEDGDKIAKTIENAKAELAKHGITSRVSLLEVGSMRFQKLNFGVFGKSKAFLSFLLPNAEYVTTQVLEQIAELFGWDDKIKTIENAKAELAKHGITSRVSLLDSKSNAFIKLKFGVFGGGRAFTTFLLGKRVNIFTIETLERIAEVLGWDDK